MGVPAPGPAEKESPGSPVPQSGSPGGRKRPCGEGIVAIVVVVLVILSVVVVLRIEGVFPRAAGGSSSGSIGEELTYNQSAPLAVRAASNASGAPWTLIMATGYFSNGSLPWNENFPDSANPIAHFLSPERPPIPSLVGSMFAGKSPFWSFLFYNGTVESQDETLLLLVVVVNDTALPIVTWWNPEFAGVDYTALPSALPFDSSAAIATARTANVSFFLAHPELNATLTIEEGRSPLNFNWTTPTWLASFTTCTLGSVGPPYFPSTIFDVIENATSGNVFSTGGPITNDVGC